jgi:hypothetical protein
MSTIAFTCLIAPIVAGWAVAVLAWLGEILEPSEPSHG